MVLWFMDSWLMEVKVRWLKGSSTSSSLNSSSCSDSCGESSGDTTAASSSGFWLMASATASTMGSIMAVVAVLEIHIERNIVVNMNPSISRAWLVPTVMMMRRATLTHRTPHTRADNEGSRRFYNHGEGPY